MAKRFSVYKGLQRPLTFKGFKGKFIYWGVGSLLLGLVAGSVTMALVNMYVGAGLLVGIIVGGLFYTAGRQKGGLHDKPRSKGIQVHPVNLKILQIYGNKKSV
jgi:hypothetical protein